MQNPLTDNVTFPQLIQDSINGCRKMQYTLYRKSAAKMFQVCLLHTNNHTEDAKDILQDGFVRVFKNLHKFRHDGSFEGWVRTNITRTALSSLKEKNKKTSARIQIYYTLSGIMTSALQISLLKKILSRWVRNCRPDTKKYSYCM